MLSQNFLAIDLNPYTWRNLAKIADIVMPSGNILFVLHENGEVINVFHPGRGLVDDIEIDFDDLDQSIYKIFSENGGVDTVQIIDKNSLIEYYSLANASNFSDLDTDEYMSFINRLLHNTKGINVYYRNNEYVDIFDRLRNFVCSNFPENCTIVLCIFEDGKLFFDAILGFKNHKLEMITSFDHFVADGFNSEITMEGFGTAADMVRQKYGDPILMYFLEKKDFANRVQDFKESV